MVSNVAIIYSVSETSINGGEIGWINHNFLLKILKKKS